MNYLGIDLGGTNIEFGIVNTENEIIYSNSFKTNTFLTAKDCSFAIFNDIKENTKHTINGIGIGAPSVNFITQNIENAPNLKWDEIIPLAEIFEATFNIKTTIVNDANAAAIGEWKFGGAKDLDNFALITLGTGVGIGLVLNGKLYHGSNGLGGEFGHICIDRTNGRECSCGGHGCLEAYVGKEGIIKTAKQKIEFSSGSSKLHNFIPSEIKSEDIFKFARKEDPVAVDIVDSISRDLGYAISILANSLDLNNIFLFGGLAKEGNFIKKKTLKAMKPFLIQSIRENISLQISELNDLNPAIIGAAYLAKNGVS
jgi:glucokinase